MRLISWAAKSPGSCPKPTIPPPRRVRSTAEMPLAPRVQSRKRKGWGFFGRKKAPAPDLRAEPVDAAPAAAPGAAAAGAAMTRASPPPSGEDLFPEHDRDEQFEIRPSCAASRIKLQDIADQEKGGVSRPFSL